ncbi:DUF3231 family protein [Paenibacillus antri]|uniref:DUF3231 family protein n=1 Tax=Paenibacillus antri TaxID=2582848 RepID=A0A5R9G866_9BACL|nr:DUF3231 family protein [Paenibacillus antri]TLS51921.1 DUF3231 family protein [Paenibacillus antri]
MTQPQPHVKPTNIELSSTEIGGLWSIYMQESMTVCFLTYFIHHLQDGDILPMAQKALHISQQRLDRIRSIFSKENFPIPDGFTDKDVNLSAPPLFHDAFALSFIYMANRMGMINYAFTSSNNVRLDVLDFFNECLHTSTELFGQAVKLQLEKGLYDRPPKMNYPNQVEYVRKTTFLDGIMGDKRPLNAIELSEIFFNIERNYFAVLVMLGFAQVMQDKELQRHILRGKKISEKQVELFNKLLMDEELLGTVTVGMEVTESTTSPFSDKLIMAMINILNAVDIVLISHAMALSMRADLIAHYSKIIGEVMLYAKDTFDIVVDRGWLEQPPLSTDRQQLLR